MKSTASFEPFPEEDLEQSISHRFKEQAARFASRPAIMTRDGSWTYEALDAATDRIAAGLLESRGSLPEPIALLFDQEPDAVIAILGILKAGKFYVPLDPSLPPAGLSGQIRSAAPGLIIAGQSHIPLAKALAEEGDVRVEALASLQRNTDISRPWVSPGPDSLAYVFYTSGSTANPKGVMDNHRNVLHNVLRYTNNLRINPGDRLSLIQSPSFSGTVSSLFTALLNGAAICPFDVRQAGFSALASWVNDMGITVYHSVPAIFRGLVAGRQRIPHVRVIRLEGDQALPSDVDLYRQYFSPGCQLAIGLGATETGLSCQCILHKTDTIESNTVPVGYPTQDMSISILDDQGADLGLMTAGEIAVRSRYLAVGYWKQPELDGKAFLMDPADDAMRTYRTGDRGRLRADGCLEFLGRQHTQPRIHGQYVEAGEIEAALQMLDGVKQAVVSVQERSPGHPQLVAFLVAEPTRLWTVAEIRKRLAGEVSTSSIPSRVVYLESLPLTGNGKVDRRALPLADDVPATAVAGHEPPRDACEATLLEIWSEALAVAEIGVNDNFFDLGGSSLAAARICAGVEEAFGSRLDADALGLHPTIADMADKLRGENPYQDAGPIVALQPRGTRPPLYFVHDHFGRISWYGPLARKLGPDQPSYGIKVGPDPQSTEGPGSIEELAAFYLDCIRSIQPAGPFHLAGLCFGGVVAFEMAQQARARGEPVDLLALIGISPYDFPGVVSPFAAALWQGHAYLSSLRRRFTGFRSHIDNSTAELSISAAKSATLAARHTQLFKQYRWRSYPGRVDLYLEAELARKYTRGAGSWQALSALAVAVHLSPFRISEMFTEDHVGGLAAELQKSLSNTGGPP